MTFRELEIGDRFVFARNGGSPAPCVKTNEREFEVEEDGSWGRVGVGDNPVHKLPASEERKS